MEEQLEISPLIFHKVNTVLCKLTGSSERYQPGRTVNSDVQGYPLCPL